MNKQLLWVAVTIVTWLVGELVAMYSEPLSCVTDYLLSAIDEEKFDWMCWGYRWKGTNEWTGKVLWRGGEDNIVQVESKTIKNMLYIHKTQKESQYRCRIWQEESSYRRCQYSAWGELKRQNISRCREDVFVQLLPTRPWWSLKPLLSLLKKSWFEF